VVAVAVELVVEEGADIRAAAEAESVVVAAPRAGAGRVVRVELAGLVQPAGAAAAEEPEGPGQPEVRAAAGEVAAG
jgi:hypothetical protein